MIKTEYRKNLYLQYMKKFKVKGEIYRQSYEPQDYASGMISLVAERNMRKYELYRAWERNGVLLKHTEDEQESILEELASFVETYSMDEVENIDEVRFVDRHYGELFSVQNLSQVRVNGEIRTVFYCDEYHFGFIETPNVYHICQWGELVHMHNVLFEKLGELKELNRQQLLVFFEQKMPIRMVNLEGKAALVSDLGYDKWKCEDLLDMGYKFYVA